MWVRVMENIAEDAAAGRSHHTDPGQRVLDYWMRWIMVGALLGEAAGNEGSGQKFVKCSKDLGMPVYNTTA
jgi:hypothetical protein